MSGEKFVPRLPPVDPQAALLARQRQSTLTKPPGSLGRLEDVVEAMAAWQGTPLPESRPAAALLFAADHPVTKHGVSAYPSAVTRAMVANFVSGGAAASVLCRRLGVPLSVVDVGVFQADDEPPLSERGAADGVSFRRDAVADAPAGDIRTEDAMSEDTFERTVLAGARAVDALDHAARVVILGEMGIGNTTVASAVCAKLIGTAPRDFVGPGTGVSGSLLDGKRRVVEDAVSRLGTAGASPATILRRIGGRDIVALYGALLRAVELRRVVLVDGFIVSAAALAAVQEHPGCRPGLIFAHRSAEPPHDAVLRALRAPPLLDLGMRLGEATGALSALPLLDAACSLHREMASFTEAGVPNKSLST